LGQLHVGGVVDDDVEPAERRNSLLDEPGDVGLLRYVRLDGPGGSGALESGHGPVQVSLGTAGNDDPGAGADEAGRRGPADPAGSAGDDRDLALELRRV